MVYMVQLAELSSTFPCERQTYDEFWWEVPGLIMEKNERQTYDEFRWEVLGLIMNSDERCHVIMEKMVWYLESVQLLSH